MKQKKKIFNPIILLVFTAIALMALIVLKQEAHAPIAARDSVPENIEANTETSPSAIQLIAEQKDVKIQETINDLNIPILMYHYIRIVEDTSDQLGINLSVTPEKFAQQLDSIKSKGYATITFEDIVKGEIPAKPIILTFDDGYKDFYTNAYPELKKHNMTAVSYIIGNKNNTQYMNEKEILEISQNNIELGSHTLSHPDLAKTSSQTAIKEITESKERIENIIGKKIVSFCYPAGKYNDETISIVKSAGYSFAVTTNPGLGELKSPLTLNRHRINADTDINTYLK